MLRTIFYVGTPLHDGGVVIRAGRISSAHCLFPTSLQPELVESGTRHRAAVGLSEETDALVLVVSEERGQVSVAHNGRLIRYPDTGDVSRASLVRWIRKAMPEQKTAYDQLADWFRRRREKAARLFAAHKSAEPTPEAEPASATETTTTNEEPAA